MNEPITLTTHPQRQTWLGRVRPRLNVTWRGLWDTGRVQDSRICFDHELVLFTAGTTRAVVGDLEFICTPGDALIQPPGAVQWSQAEVGPVERCTFHFDWDHSQPPGALMPYRFLDQPAKHRDMIKSTPTWVALPLPWFVRGIDARALRLVADIHRILRTSSATDLLIAEARFMELLALVLAGSTQRAEVAPNLAWVQAVKSALEQSVSSELDLAVLASDHGVSREHLTRVFTRRLGIPPLAYRTGQRLEFARRLLREGSAVADAAHAVGLADPRYFTRIYTKRFGLAPSREAGNVHLTKKVQPLLRSRR